MSTGAVIGIVVAVLAVLVIGYVLYRRSLPSHDQFSYEIGRPKIPADHQFADWRGTKARNRDTTITMQDYGSNETQYTHTWTPNA